MRFVQSMVLGKFMPLHRGHMHLIQSAVEQSKQVTILACSLTRQPIPGQLRYRWVRETFPECNTIHIKDDSLPQEPHEHPQFWSIWTNLIRNNCPRNLECIFSSEPYGKTLADQMNIKHYDVDIKRQAVPISGTKIREKPLTHWNYISDAAKSYFVKRIVLMGPESSGKTTLCQKLARHYQTQWVPQYGRQLSQRKPNLTLLDFKDIVANQIRNEEAMCKSVNKLLICDTECITTMIFSWMYFPKEAHTLKEFFEDAIKKYTKNYELYLLLKPIGSGVKDGTRLFLQKRYQHYEVIKKQLQSRQLPMEILDGDYEDIYRKACNAIDRRIMSKY